MINYILLSIIILIIVVYIFKNNNTDNNNNNINNNNDNNNIDNNNINNIGLSSDYKIDVNNYINNSQKYIFENQNSQQNKERIIRKKFNDEFFKFRDFLHKDSSNIIDSVDRSINTMLDNNNYNNIGTNIKDIYDNLTQNRIPNNTHNIPISGFIENDNYNYEFMNDLKN